MILQIFVSQLRELKIYTYQSLKLTFRFTILKTGLDSQECKKMVYCESEVL